MSAAAITRLIEGRPRDLGGFTVRRLLPAAGTQTVGPFIFLDHMGPVRFAAGSGVDVRPHPHIGLATVTYLFAGEFLHRDSLGTEQRIRPGDVNWMVAGRGIVHSERTPPELRRGGDASRVEGIQAWVALPRDHEETEPSFAHHPARALPELRSDGARLRLIAGEAYGERSPVATFSPLFYLDARLEATAHLELPQGHAERGAYVAAGEVDVAGTRCGVGQLVLFAAGAEATLEAATDARVMLLGGAPLDGPRTIWWNFVSSSPERIEQAKRDWRERKFAAVPGDPERIPLPEG